MRVVGADKATLIATHFLEQFYTNVRLSMFGAGVVAFPVIATQIYGSSRRACTSTRSRRFGPI